MTLPEQISAAIATLNDLLAKHYALVHGAVGTYVTTDSGPVPSIATKMSSIGAAIVSGYNAGYLIVVANAAGRTAAQAGQVNQMLYQADTAKLYKANSTTAGDFSLHPLQASVDAPGTAITALAALITTLQTWQATVDPENDGVANFAGAIKGVYDATTPTGDQIVIHAKDSAGTTGVKTITTPRYYELFASLGGVGTSSLENTARKNQLNGFVCGITLAGRLMVWGNQTSAGVFGRGSVTAGVAGIQPASLRNNGVRPMPAFAPLARKVKQVIANGYCVHALLDDGTVAVAGPASSNIWDVYGTNASAAPAVFWSIYFNQSSANKAMVAFDSGGQLGVAAYASFISIDTDGAVWIMTCNPYGIGYSNSLTVAQRIPLNVSAGVGGWSGKTATKVRCSGAGAFMVLMSDKTLWAASGVNSTGFLGLGSTSTLGNFTQIATGVDDFEFAGDNQPAYYSLFILQGTTLKGAGYNGYGTLGTGNTTNQTSFVTIGTNITKIRLGGDYATALLALKADGTMWGVGFNTSGCLGSGGASNLTTLTSITALNTILATDAPVDWCVSSFAGSGSSALVTTSGRGYATGSNDLGQLGVGDFTDRTAWTEVCWQPVNSSEKLVAVQPFVANSRAHFQWITNMGRVLVSGYDSLSGFTSGVPGYQTGNTAVLTPIRIP